MTDKREHVTVSDVEQNAEKPGKRWELSPELGIEAFNFNVAVLESDERLSQNHFHYHEEQQELVYVIDGRCRVETQTSSFEMDENEVVAFDAGEEGAHVVHNPFDEPCKLIAVGWPPEGRYPVRQLEETDALLEKRDDETQY